MLKNATTHAGSAAGSVAGVAASGVRGGATLTGAGVRAAYQYGRSSWSAGVSVLTFIGVLVAIIYSSMQGNIVFLFVSLGLLAAVIVSAWSKAPGKWLMTSAVCIHLIHLGLGAIGIPGLLKLVIVLIMYGVLTGHANSLLQGQSKGPYIATFLAFGIPLIINLIRFSSTFMGFSGEIFDWATFFYMVFPVWVIYILMFFPNSREIIGAPMFWAGWIYILGFLTICAFAYGGPFVGQMNAVVPVLSGSQWGAFGGQFGHITQTMSDQLKQGFWEAKKSAKQASQRVAERLNLNDTFYRGRVDRNAKERLGVYFEKFKLDRKDVYADGELGIFGTLTAKSMDDTFLVNMSCYASNRNDEYIEPNLVYPERPINVSSEEVIDVDCQFTGESLGEGTSYIYLVANFDFETLAYLKRYYMNQETLRALRATGVDPLKEYGIVDRNPMAVHTNGPVTVGMDIGTALTGLDLEREYTQMSLGVTVSNRWDGKIRNITRMVVLLPKGLQMVEAVGSSNTFTPLACSDLGEPVEMCDDELYTLYDVYVEAADITAYKTFRFLLRTDDPTYLLGPGPLATRLFRVAVDYDYALEQKARVKVKKARVDDNTPAGSSDPAKVIEGTLLTEVHAETATIRFQTDQPTQARLQYFMSPTAKKTIMESDYATDHEIVISGLLPSSQYTVTVDLDNGQKTTSVNPFFISTHALQVPGGTSP